MEGRSRSIRVLRSVKTTQLLRDQLGIFFFLLSTSKKQGERIYNILGLGDSRLQFLHSQYQEAEERVLLGQDMLS